MSSDYHGKHPDEIRDIAVAKCGQVGELLATKSNAAEASQYKHWVISVGERVANAAKEGGFLGIGGERVSAEERTVIEAITTALGVG